MHITIASMRANGQISESVVRATTTCTSVVFQTDTVGKETLDEQQISFATLDDIYNTAENFDDLTERACTRLMQDGLLFVVLGDVYHNRIAVEVIRRVKQDGGSVTVIPDGDTALCIALEQGVFDRVAGVSIYAASTFEQTCDTDNILVVHEIDTRFTASELKLKLGKFYDDEHAVFICDTRSLTGRCIPLCMLDTQGAYGYYTSVVLPPCSLENKKRYTYADLIRVMDKLRGNDGCPWDKEQTHKSLKRYLVEESYEVLEAIDDDDMDALYDELGDVLLQVVFHAKIAQQHSEFDHMDITSAICNKMISRHTHIFGSSVASTPDEVVDNWEQIKKAEKGQQTQTDVLRNVPKSMPALMRSGKVQHKAAHVGFDFEDVSQAIDKLKEEIIEVEQDLGSEEKIVEECGDLLFSAVNVVRLASVEPETALQKATDKFINRFAEIEKIALSQNLDMRSCNIMELNKMWAKVKAKLGKYK